jgi:hypothetical protein
MKLHSVTSHFSFLLIVARLMHSDIQVGSFFFLLFGYATRAHGIVALPVAQLFHFIRLAKNARRRRLETAASQAASAGQKIDFYDAYGCEYVHFVFFPASYHDFRSSYQVRTQQILRL